MNLSARKLAGKPGKKTAPGESAVFPMRINKYLALHNYATRRGADDLIIQGQVFINGRRAVLGDRVAAADNVEVRSKGKPKAFTYIAYNKPRGMATYYAGEEPRAKTGMKEKRDGYPAELKNVFAVGGLDKDSHGLILLTDDGRVTERLLSSKYNHEREYLVRTKNPLRSSFKQKMEAGVAIENERAKPCKVRIIGETAFRAVLTEEKKHQVRRMCAALFQEVDDIQRVRIMNISLGNLKAGSYRVIEGAERAEFLRALL